MFLTRQNVVLLGGPQSSKSKLSLSYSYSRVVAEAKTKGGIILPESNKKVNDMLGKCLVVENCFSLFSSMSYKFVASAKMVL